MPCIDTALGLMAEKFHGVKDKAGEPYILHCLRVMLGVEGTDCQLVALMHDLIEDTDTNLEDLRQLGFSDAVLEGLDLITHKPSDSYCDYVIRLKVNPLARSAKLSDLRDNYSIQRVAYRGDHEEQDSRRIRKYALSYQFLTDQISESDYRRRMSELED